MKPCTLLFPVTICYIICGIHGVWQNNGRGFVFRGLGGRAGQPHLREKDNASGYNVGDPNFVNNGDLRPIIIPLNGGVGNSLDEGAKSSTNDYNELTVPVLTRDSSELHSSEEEDHEFSSNTFNIGGETNADNNVNVLTSNMVDNIYDERQNNMSGILNVEMKDNAGVGISGHSQDIDLSINGEGSASHFNHAAQSDVNENRGAYYYPPYNGGGNFLIGANGITNNFKLPIQEGFHNINVAAKGDVESGGFVKGNIKECSCSSKSNGSPIATQSNAIHGIYSEGHVNGDGVFNSEIFNGGGYNIGGKGMNSYYNFPLQNNNIHSMNGLYKDWQGLKGRDPNIEIQDGGVFNKDVKGITNGYFNYPVQAIQDSNRGTQGDGGGYINYQHNNMIHGLNKGTHGGSYINYIHDNRMNGLYTGGHLRPSGGGDGFHFERLANSYSIYPGQYYSTIHGPYYSDSRYFNVNGYEDRDINMKTQGGDERGHNVAGHYYNFPKKDSMIQGFNAGGQINKNRFDAKGNGIVSNSYDVPIHGHNLTGNANYKTYTGGQVNTNGGLNVGIQNGGSYSSKIKGNSLINSYYKLPTQIYTEDALNAGEQGNQGNFNIVAQDNKGIYNIEEKLLPIQNQPENLNLPGAYSNFNHALQNFVTNGEQVNKETGTYFKIQGNEADGFYFVPFKVPSCSCQQAGFPIGDATGQVKLKDSFKGGVQSNVGGDLNDGVQSVMKNRLNGNTQANIEGFSKLKENIIEQNNMHPQVSSAGSNHINGNIAQNNLMNGIHAVGLDSSESNINGNLQQGISHFAGGMNTGEFGDLGGHPKWFSNFGGEMIPPWLRNIESGYTNFVGGVNTGGGIYGGTGNGYVHGMDTHTGILNNGDGRFLGPEFGHFKRQLNLIGRNNGEPLSTIIVRKGNKFGGLKGKPLISLKKIVKEKLQSNVNDRLYADNLKNFGSRLDGDGFGNPKEEFNNNKLNLFDDDKTSLLAPIKNFGSQLNKNRIDLVMQRYLNNIGKRNVIGNGKNTTEFRMKQEVLNRDQINTPNRIGFFKGWDRYPKMGPIGVRGFRPERIGRLHGYNKVFGG